ncbi:HTH domain-containing protein [Enterococcus termitis]
MQLSKRELVIIDLFLKHDLSLTANQLAYFTNVSTKTIYRTVKKINDQSDSGDLIISEPSKGFVLDYDRFLKENAKVGRGIQTTDPLERRNSVMLRLLFKAPNKVDIHYLFEPFYVSDAAVSGDIQRITEYLKTYHLQVKRSQKKLSIEGAERNIRKAVLSIIAKDNLIDDVFTIDGQLMNAYDIDFLTSLLDFIDKMLKTSITYPYNVNIFSHLYILVQRTREGKILFSEERFLLDSEEEELIKKIKNSIAWLAS